MGGLGVKHGSTKVIFLFTELNLTRVELIKSVNAIFHAHPFLLIVIAKHATANITCKGNKKPRKMHNSLGVSSTTGFDQCTLKHHVL